MRELIEYSKNIDWAQVAAWSFSLSAFFSVVAIGARIQNSHDESRLNVTNAAPTALPEELTRSARIGSRSNGEM